MTASAFIEALDTGDFRATLLGWPEMTALGATEEEAVGRLREVVQARLAQGKIVALNPSIGSGANPWLGMSKWFRDNPLLDDVERVIRDERGMP